MNITPDANTLLCRYTLLEPVSHHDPGQGDSSNFLLYRRQLWRRHITDIAATAPLDQAHITDITDANQVPVAVAKYFTDEPFARFVAVCITKTFIQQYGGYGTGLFSGAERYRRLEDRLTHTATRTNTVKSFWSVLTKEMNVPSLPGDKIRGLMDLLVHPRTFESSILYEFAKYAQMIVMLARVWVEEERDTLNLTMPLSELDPTIALRIIGPLQVGMENDNIKEDDLQIRITATPNTPIAAHNVRITTTEKAKGAVVSEAFPEDLQTAIISEVTEKLNIDRQNPAPTTPLSFEPDTDFVPEEVSVALPTHSGNDIRHDIREALMYHLLETLNIDFEADDLPMPIKILLENGGAMSESSPNDAYRRAQTIRKNYPMFGLLGGCMPGYMLGEGNLQSVSCFFKGYENNAALEEFGIQSNHSVLELLDQYTLTKHAVRTEDTPMPFSFEVMQPGTELFVRFQFHPFSTEIELGAFATAMLHFEQANAAIGGQAARGFGRVKVDYLKEPDPFWGNATLYQDHLEENRDRLREGLLNGTLGVEK